MTVHKSQGSGFRNVLFVLPDEPGPLLTRELLYTAVTRAEERVELWGSEEVITAALQSRTVRQSGAGRPAARILISAKIRPEQFAFCTFAGYTISGFIR